MTGCLVVLSNSVEFASFEAADVAGELDGGDLHAEADAEIRDLVFAGVLGGQDLALGAAVAEAAGNEDAVHVADDGLRAVILDGLGVHADDLHLGVVMGAGVDERFVDRFVGVLQLDVFAGDGDGHLVFRMDDALHETLPILERGRRRVAEADLVHHEAVDLVAAEVERAFVNRVVHIAEGDDVLALDVAEHGDLLPVVLIEVRLGAADDDVRLDADLAELGDRLLGGLGFHLAGGLDVGQQRDVDEADVFLADFERELAQGLEEKQAFHVADGAADLGDEHIHVRIVRRSPCWMRSLISSVTCGMNCTVFPRYSPRRSFLMTESKTWPEVRLFMRESTPEVKRS